MANQRSTPVSPRYTSALLASTLSLAPLLVTVDAIFALVGGAIHHRQFEYFGGPLWGLRTYVVALWATSLGMLLLATFEILIVASAHRMPRVFGSRRAPPPLALSTALWTLPLTGYLAHYLLSGGTMRRLLPGVAPRVGLAVALCLLVFGASWFWHSRLEPLILRHRRSMRIALGLTVLGLVAGDLTLLPGLYDGIHGLMILLATVLLQRLLWDVGRSPLTRPRRIVLGALLGALMLGVPLLIPWDRRPVENFVVARLTVFSGHYLRLAGQLRLWLLPRSAPPAPRERRERVSVARLRRTLGVRDGRMPDVFVLMVDGLSPWRSSMGHYRRDTTPFLAQMARKGVNLTRAYSTAPGTVGSMRSLLSGTFQNEHKQSLQRPTLLLLQRFRALGYLVYCDLPLAKDIIGPLGSLKTCDVLVSFERAQWSRDSLLSVVSGSSRPVFAVVLFSATHPPYQSFHGIRFGDGAGDRYDAALVGTDRVLRTLYRQIHQLGRPTRFIFTADHGNAFGWHGLYGHNSSLYEDQIRVPLILVDFPLSPRTVSRPVSLLDLTGMLAGGRGDDLSRLIDGSHRRPDTVVAAFFKEQATIIEGDHKLLVDGSVGSAESYDVRTDPREQNNILSKFPSLARSLERRLKHLTPRCGAGPGSPSSGAGSVRASG